MLAEPLVAVIAALAAPSSQAESRNDHIWGARARAEAMQRIVHQSRQFFADALPGSEWSAGVGLWPFDGLAPEPPKFELAALPAPIASIEWRREKGALVESFAIGADPDLDAIRAARPVAGVVAKEPVDWARAGGIPDALECERQACGWANGTDRNNWCSVWADCYEIDAGGVRLVVVRDVAAENAGIVAVLTGPDGMKATRIGEMPSDSVESTGASNGVVLAVADFDGNGSRDCFVSEVVTGCGLALTHYTGYFVLTDAKAGRARATPFASSGVEWIDLDRNGRAEVLSMTFDGSDQCLDGKRHNFFITNLLGFQDLGVVDLREVHRIRNGDFVGRFPAFEWYANDPAERFRPLLSEADMRKMGATPYPRYAR